MGDDDQIDDEPDEHEAETRGGKETTGEIDDPPSEERSDSPVEQTMMDSDAETQDAAAVEPGESVGNGVAVEPGESVGENDEDEENEADGGEENEPDRTND